MGRRRASPNETLSHASGAERGCRDTWSMASQNRDRHFDSNGKGPNDSQGLGGRNYTLVAIEKQQPDIEATADRPLRPRVSNRHGSPD